MLCMCTIDFLFSLLGLNKKFIYSITVKPGYQSLWDLLPVHDPPNSNCPKKIHLLSWVLIP